MCTGREREKVIKKTIKLSHKCEYEMSLEHLQTLIRDEKVDCNGKYDMGLTAAWHKADFVERLLPVMDVEGVNAKDPSVESSFWL